MKLSNWLFALPLIFTLTGCPIGENDGDTGTQGKAGTSGINCWDLNGDHVKDLDEDVNLDGIWDALDCSGAAATTQSNEAELNHQHFCEAFANLGQYPEGCPSASHSTPTGTLTKIYKNTSSLLFDDSAEGYSTCNFAPSNGLLSIVKRTGTDQAWFELSGGYIARKTVYARSDEILNELCFADCNNDSKCIASLAQSKTSEAMECLVFYHSDTVSRFEKICGIDSQELGMDARDVCTVGMGNQHRWTAKCP